MSSTPCLQKHVSLSHAPTHIHVTQTHRHMHAKHLMAAIQ